MAFKDYIIIFGLLFTAVSLIGAMMWRFGKEVKDLAIDSETKRGRIYDRLDENKNYTRQSYVDQIIYDEHRKEYFRDMNRLDATIKSMTGTVNQGFIDLRKDMLEFTSSIREEFNRVIRSQ